MCRFRTVRRRRAFTRIELLVLIAIVGILVSMVVVAISKSLAFADNNKCQYKLLQLGKGMSLYEADSKGFIINCSGTSAFSKFTPFIDGGGPPGEVTGGVHFPLFRCPLDGSDLTTTPDLTSYRLNSNFCGTIELKKADAMPYPATTIVAGEILGDCSGSTSQWGNTGGPFTCLFTASNPATMQVGATPTTCVATTNFVSGHMRSCNFLCGDGNITQIPIGYDMADLYRYCQSRKPGSSIPPPVNALP